jgi:hypothetical protein
MKQLHVWEQTSGKRKELEPSHIAGRNGKRVQSLKKSLAAPWKVKHKLSSDLDQTRPGEHPVS